MQPVEQPPQQTVCGLELQQVPLVALLHEKGNRVARTVVQPRQGLLGRPSVTVARRQVLERHVRQENVYEMQTRTRATLDGVHELLEALLTPGGQVGVQAPVALALRLTCRTACVRDRLSRVWGTSQAAPVLRHSRKLTLQAIG